MPSTKQNLSLPTLPYGTALTGSAATLWATAILQAIKAPTTNANVNTLIGWFHNEGGGGQNNPMNTTLDTSGATGSINSDGVKDYATPADGVSATAQTLLGGYPAIVSQLRGGSGLSNTSGAVASELSTWSGGGYSSITPITASGSIPKTAIGPGPNGGIVRSGGNTSSSSGGSSAAVGSLLDSYQSSLEQPTQSGTDYVSLSSTLFGWIPGYSQVSSAVTDVSSFLSFIAWIFSPLTLLRAVEFLTGIAIMGFGIETAFKSIPGQQRQGFGGAVNAVGNLPQNVKGSKLVQFAMKEPIK